MFFPDVTDKDYSKGGNKNEDVHQILDYAATQWESRRERRKRLNKLYDSHNGVINEAEINAITKRTGKESKTKYIKYRLGRSKLRQLHGEFLEINITPTVSTINRNAINEKMSKYKTQLGLAISKPYIDSVRSMGYDVFPGMKIPDINDKKSWAIDNFKLQNEEIMQTILDDKLSKEHLKIKFHSNFVDLTIAAEVFGKVERDVNGIDTYRPISPQFALFEENVNDPFLKRTPYFGEVRMMYPHEIIQSKEFNLSDDEKKLIQEYEIGNSDYKDGSIEMIDGIQAIPVFILQWKGLEVSRTMISEATDSEVPYKTTLSEEYYNKNKKRLVEKDMLYFERTGQHLLDISYREILWTAARIGKTIYTNASKENDLIQVLNANGVYNVQFDYSGMLFNTVNGIRISIQEIVYELEKIYDDIRFMMNKELKKVRGDIIAYDDAFLPKNKRFIDIDHDISEDGVVHFNSSAEGNRSGTESDSNKVGIQSLNMGNNQILNLLLTQAMDVERILDRITGMNENRQGLAKATMTATANINNIEASRSMTYDLFYFMTEYMQDVLSKLCEKTKINKVFRGEDSRLFIFDEEQIKYILSTKNLINDNYGVTVTDGKRERDILMKIEGLFPQEINAGFLRTKDVANFYKETNFASAIKVLDKAHDELAKLRQEEERVKQETSNKQIQSNLQITREDREDRQNHDKEMEVLRTEGKKEIETLKSGMQAQMDYQNNIIKASSGAKQTSNIFEQ